MIVYIENADDAVVTLTNTAGSTVARQKVKNTTTQIPVHSLAKGYYFISVQTYTGVETHKVFIKWFMVLESCIVY